MKKWEYLYAFLGTYDQIRSSSPMASFNRYGGNGWELVSIYEKYAFFKREVIENKQVKISEGFERSDGKIYVPTPIDDVPF